MDQLAPFNPNLPVNDLANRKWFDKLVALVNSMFGINQSWQNMTSGRLLGSTYTNNTPKPIAVKVTVESTAESFEVNEFVNGNQISVSVLYGPTSTYYLASDIIVPPGATYKITMSSANLYAWWELR